MNVARRFIHDNKCSMNNISMRKDYFFCMVLVKNHSERNFLINDMQIVETVK